MGGNEENKKKRGEREAKIKKITKKIEINS